MVRKLGTHLFAHPSTWVILTFASVLCTYKLIYDVSNINETAHYQMIKLEHRNLKKINITRPCSESIT